MWRTVRLTSQTEIAAFLRTDRVYAAYALGDLEPDYLGLSEWYGAEAHGALETLALVFRGMQPPALFVMGAADGFAMLLGSVLHERRVTYMLQERHLAALRAFYRISEPAPMWRMAVRANAFRTVRSEAVRRLYPGDTRQLQLLYEQSSARPGEEVLAFTPAQVEQGVFYGVRAHGSLVAAAGTHLVARSRKLAIVGNVFTHPEHRRQGHATACTAAVTAELLGSGMVDVVLNVAQGNQAAMALYERLGYAIMCPFYEGLGVRKGVH